MNISDFFSLNTLYFFLLYFGIAVFCGYWLGIIIYSCDGEKKIVLSVILIEFVCLLIVFNSIGQWYAAIGVGALAVILGWLFNAMGQSDRYEIREYLVRFPSFKIESKK